MGILKKIAKNIDDYSWKGDFPVYYLYSCGEAGEIFFKNLKEKGVFTGAKCPCCGKVYLPPRIYCEECFEEIKEFLEVPLTGRIETFTIVQKDIDGNSLGCRKAVAFVKIDGTCGGIIGFVLCEPEKVKTAMRVIASLKPASQRKGSMDDIAGFEPIFL